MWNDTLTELRDVLAGLYPTVEDSRRLVDEVGLSPAHIPFNQRAINNWHNILRQAHDSGEIQALVAIARREYPNHQGLERAEGAYRQFEESLSPASTPLSCQPRSKSSSLIPTVNLPMDYELGLTRLGELLEHQAPGVYAELSTLAERFRRNQWSERVFGSSQNTGQERSQIIYALNELALTHCGKSFNELCSGEI